MLNILLNKFLQSFPLSMENLVETLDYEGVLVHTELLSDKSLRMKAQKGTSTAILNLEITSGAALLLSNITSLIVDAKLDDINLADLNVEHSRRDDETASLFLAGDNGVIFIVREMPQRNCKILIGPRDSSSKIWSSLESDKFRSWLNTISK